MDQGSNQLQKIRTFHTDVAGVRPEDNKVKEVVPKTPPTVSVPPIMTPEKPEPLVNQTQKPVEKTAAINNNLAQEIKSLGIKKNFDQNDRINLMDTDSEVMEGTIITDQKRDRFKLLPAMSEAIGGWFKEGKNAIEERAEKKRQAIPKVNKVEERKAVVEKAAAGSALAPKDDHKKLAAKLPESVKKSGGENKPALVISKKDPDAKPTWSHFEGEQVKTQTPTPTPNVTATETIPTKNETAPVAPVIPPTPKPIEVLKAIPAEPVTQKTEPAKEEKPPAKEIVPQVEPVEIVIGKKPEPEVRKWRPTPAPKRRFKIPSAVVYASVVVVAFGAVGGGVALSFWFFSSNQGVTATNPLDSEVKTKAVELLSNDRLIEVPLPSNRNDLYNNLIEQREPNGGIILFALMVGGGSNSVRASSDQVMSTLSWTASPALLRSIKEISLGSLGESPYIVAKVTSFDTAFGGLLAAEENLSSDLSPLFGTEVDETFDPDNQDFASTTPSLPAFFVDDVVRNHDVRVLRDRLEAERIVYGFVSQNTVVITTDRATFSAIAEAVK